ncbi:hypothetical protein GCM10019016_119670 [Streptomyces prasinosporus]|uniref:Uncharacterized protein n=1 Tax=Streptomyces prasinosporus TaxID=68256 RepID=A0ABP6UBM7_9ACTN
MSRMNPGVPSGGAVCGAGPASPMMIAAAARANRVEPAVERAVNTGFRASDSLCRHAARRPPHGRPIMYMTGVDASAPRE